MAEGILASAVAVVAQPEEPEHESKPALSSPETGHKRRQSSISDSESKRRRTSEQYDRSPRDSRRSPSQHAADRDPDSRRPVERRVGGGVAAEERKRSKRLFGGLLGALSQSSPSTAQKRRADIEQRQQAKLRMQDEQHTEARQKKKDELLAERRSQQKELERQAMNLKHRNLLQTANFLRTKTEPVLLWLPYQLRREDDGIIDKQIEEAKEIIAREETEFEERWRLKNERQNHERNANDKNAPPDTSQDGDRSNQHDMEGPSDLNANENAKQELEPATEDPGSSNVTKREADKDGGSNGTAGASQRNDDEGEEVMEEDKEDMVIY